MASTFTAMSCAGSLVSLSVSKADKRLVNSSEALSSFTSLSSQALGGRREKVILRKRLGYKVQAMAKDLHFNKDGSAVKKLQVQIHLFDYPMVSVSSLFCFIFLVIIHFLFHFRQVLINLQIWLVLLSDPKEEMLF